MSVFLQIAEQVLEDFGNPMSAKDIYYFASEKNLFKSKGLTPENTLRARLSENIRNKGSQSVFIRVASNKFALRKWDNIEEFKAKPFEKNTIDEYVVCISQDQIDQTGRFFGFNNRYKKYLKILENPNNLTVIQRGEANIRPDLKQITSYVLLKDKYRNYLSYKRGNYSNKNQLLKDVLCIGFGGHVNRDDFINLFGIENGGIWNAAFREVAEEIKTLRLYDFKLIGVINDDSSYLGLTHFAFVFEASLPDDFSVDQYNTELSINKLKLLSKKQLKENFYKLEFWSQILAGRINKDAKNSVKIIRKKRGLRTPIAIVGGIGSGKSEVSRIIARSTGYKYISTREIVSRLIDEIDFKNSNRAQFQEKATTFISQSGSTKILANEIFREVVDAEEKAIIDGIRNIETYERLKSLCPKIMLIYIETSRDKAYEFFKLRSKRDISINEFREAVSHDIEKEIPLFKHRADVYIFNGENIKKLTDKILKWVNEK